MPTAIAVTGADLVLPPVDPGTPRATVLPPPEGRPLDASVADMQQLLARYGHVIVVCPTSAPAAVERRLHAVRALLESDRIALVRTELPPLGAAVLVRQLCRLAGCDFSPGVLASAARLLAHYIYAGAVLNSVSRLDRVPVGLGSHLKSWLPGAHFAVLAAPTPQMVRVGTAEDALAGPEFTTELLLARGQLQTDWPTTVLAPRWRIPGPVQEAPLPAASPGWWGTGKLVEFAAYLPDLPVLHQLVSSVRRELCHWCGMDLIGDRCCFCAAPLTRPEPGAGAGDRGTTRDGRALEGAAARTSPHALGPAERAPAPALGPAHARGDSAGTGYGPGGYDREGYGYGSGGHGSERQSSERQSPERQSPEGYGPAQALRPIERPFGPAAGRPSGPAAPPTGRVPGPAGRPHDPAGQSYGPAGQPYGPAGRPYGPAGQTPGPAGHVPAPAHRTGPPATRALGPGPDPDPGPDPGPGEHDPRTLP